MAFGRFKAAHRGIPTTTYQRDDDFTRFCQRQAARAEAVSRRIWRRYTDRILKLAPKDPNVSTVTVQRRGYTYGGSPKHLGEVEDDR